jgi:hypothetical protein
VDWLARANGTNHWNTGTTGLRRLTACNHRPRTESFAGRARNGPGRLLLSWFMNFARIGLLY